MAYSEPGPPSSQTPSEAYDGLPTQVLAHCDEMGLAIPSNSITIVRLHLRIDERLVACHPPDCQRTPTAEDMSATPNEGRSGPLVHRVFLPEPRLQALGELTSPFVQPSGSPQSKAGRSTWCSALRTVRPVHGPTPALYPCSSNETMLQLSSSERFRGGIAVPGSSHSPPAAHLGAQPQASSLLVTKGPEHTKKSVPTAGSTASTAGWALPIVMWMSKDVCLRR